MLSLRTLAHRVIASLAAAVAYVDEAAAAYRIARDHNDLRALETVMARPGVRR